MEITLKIGLCIGGLPMETKETLDSFDVIVGTLGRVQSLFSLENRRFLGINLLILDEADTLIEK
jgi:superfamily II DNA/RNA helicase